MEEFQLPEDLSKNRCEDSEINSCIKFICNLSFSDVLDPCRNVKFPGALVVSLSRNDLPLLKGRSPFHVTYKPTDIIPWISPVDRHIPPFQFHENAVSTPASHTAPIIVETKYDLDTTKLDFGEEDKLFMIVSPLNVLISQLDFGLSDGLFLVT